MARLSPTLLSLLIGLTATIPVQTLPMSSDIVQLRDTMGQSSSAKIVEVSP